MADLKTKRNKASVAAFLKGIEDDQMRRDARELAKMMREITGAKAEMWGPSIVGFGRYHYVYESGREGDWMLVGFAPRKAALTLYIMSGFGQYQKLLGKLGKHRTGKSCLYIKRLDDVDRGVLERLIRSSVEHLRKTHRA